MVFEGFTKTCFYFFLTKCSVQGLAQSCTQVIETVFIILYICSLTGFKQEEEGTTEDEMVGWHHQFNGHEFEQAPGDGEGQGSLVRCSPWGCKELGITE